MGITVFFHTGNFDAKKKHVSLNQHKSLNQHESHVQNPSSFEIAVAARYVSFALRRARPWALGFSLENGHYDITICTCGLSGCLLVHPMQDSELHLGSCML
jgi:hypothetical protein